MDFNDNQKEADFRVKVREFLDKNAKKKEQAQNQLLQMQLRQKL